MKLSLGCVVLSLFSVMFGLSCGDDDVPVDGSTTQDGAPKDAATAKRDKLSQTGLYEDIATKKLNANVIEFEPSYKLWSDAAIKTRWVLLPENSKIDTSDMNRWQFPVGTKVFKQFMKDGILVETRLIEKLGDGPQDYWMGAFIWRLDESDADFAPLGDTDVNNTTLDVPGAEVCWKCHNGEPGKILGFSAVQLSRPGTGTTLDSLASQGLLSVVPSGAAYTVPGDETASAALGYLHANCGHCHNSQGLAWPDTGMTLRLEVEDTTLADTAIYKTTVDVDLNRWIGQSYKKRIVSGMPKMSAILARMSARGDKAQMPPIATEIADDTGIAIVTAWISSLK